MEKEQLQERKEHILECMKSPAYVPMKRKDMRVLLGVPEEDRTYFEQIIAELIDEGKIFETKRGKLAVPETLQMATGTFISHAKGFGFVTPDEGGADIFIPASETNGAMQKDHVLYKVTGGGGSGRKAEGTIIRVLERGMTRLVGLYEQVKGFGFVTADDKKVAKDIFISRENSMGAVTGHKVVVEITDYGEDRRNPEGKIIEILGHINDPGVDILSVIRRYELPVEFPEEVYQEIENVELEINEKEMMGREDLRNVLTITIDGEDSKDLDDAVSLTKLDNGNYELGVHIADVSHYVQENTALDKEAYERGTSVYLVDRVIPMLPHKLSNGICSLNPHEDRLALSCIMEIDHRGYVVNHRVVNSVIYSDYRMTYTAVREILEDKTPELLEKYGEKYDYETIVIAKEMDGNRKISSTYIREELKKGNMEKVTSLMGRDYFVEGQVVHGRGMGHKVLLPTTNLVPPRTKILPPNGVYVTSSYFGDKIYHGITNIGCKPTVGESFIGVETYLFDCKEDLYGEECRVDFKKFLRPERKFPSLEALKSRLLADAEDGRRFFEKTEK